MVSARAAQDDEEVHPALEPIYPLNAPGESITLFRGPVKGFADGVDVEGTVQLHCVSKLDLSWRITEDEENIPRRSLLDIDDVNITLQLPTGDHTFPAHRRDFFGGWLDGTSVGDADAPLARVVAHWMNLPAMSAPTRITGGDKFEWFTGRWAAIIDGWKIVIDRRPDHSDVWALLREKQAIAITHVMEVRREDGSCFTASEVKPVLTALQFSLSFAAGRWVAPALPVGLDASGHLRWQEWGTLHCTPGRSSGLAWWWHDGNDTEEYLRCTIPRFKDEEDGFTLRFLMTSAVLMNSTGFVEQRIMTAFSAIEHLTWVVLKVRGGMSKRAYDRLGAAGRLREVLNHAGIPCGIDGQVLSKLEAYITAAQSVEGPRDGPTAVARIRNEIVHPKEPRGTIYTPKGLVQEAWFLVYHYLTLLLLFEVAYRGSYQSVIKEDRWYGDVEPVPWANQSP